MNRRTFLKSCSTAPVAITIGLPIEIIASPKEDVITTVRYGTPPFLDWQEWLKKGKIYHIADYIGRGRTTQGDSCNCYSGVGSFLCSREPKIGDTIAYFDINKVK